MSVKISDILKLPSMKGAEVLTKKSRLDQVVTSTTVLEYVAMNEIQKTLRNNIHFKGNEMVLTSFAAISHDVEAQCANIRYQVEFGEVAMVLYYVGIVMPRVDEKLIQTADKVGMVLICMPKEDLTLAYSDLINDAFSAISLDKEEHPNFVIDVLNTITDLPQRKQNLATTLEIISNRLGISLALFNKDWFLLGESVWPHHNQVRWQKNINFEKLQDSDKQVLRVNDSKDNLFYDKLFGKSQQEYFYLLITCDKEKLNESQHSQIIQILKTVMKLWSQRLFSNNSAALVDCLIEGDKVQSLLVAHDLHVDINSYSGMWIMQLKDKNSTDSQNISKAARMFDQDIICEMYHNDMILLYKHKQSLPDIKLWGEQIAQYFTARYNSISYFTDINELQQYEKFYQLDHKFSQVVKKIFPTKIFYNEQELLFSKKCQSLIQENDGNVRMILTKIEDCPELIDTLSAYLLDAHANINQAAQSEFVHRNTIKYRLRKVEDILGFSIDEQPMSSFVTQAIAISRIMSS